MRYRPQRGGLSEAIAEQATLSGTLASLVEHLEKTASWARPAPWNVKIEPYFMRRDTRIDWDKTWLVSVAGIPVGYTDGPLICERYLRLDVGKWRCDRCGAIFEDPGYPPECLERRWQ